jgi:integrase
MIERFKSGCVWRQRDVWYFRAGRNGKAQRIGTVQQYRTESKARIAAQKLVYEGNKVESLPVVTLGAVISRYRKEKMPRRESTKRGYESWLSNHIEPRWQDVAVSEVKAYEVEQWLFTLELSNKSRAEIRSILGRLLDAAMLWRFLPKERNEMELVSLSDLKPKTKPRMITPEEFVALLKALEEPFRTMVCVAQYHGLGASEVLALKWKDVDWLDCSFRVERSIVNQIEDRTKTPNRDTRLPLDDDELLMLRAWRQQSEFTEPDNYLFASPHSAGEKPYHYTSYLWKIGIAAKKAGIPRITTHTFRHTYRAWGGTAGIPLLVMKDLMRHADVRTTANVYGGPVDSAMRKAHRQIMEIAKSAQ